MGSPIFFLLFLADISITQQHRQRYNICRKLCDSFSVFCIYHRLRSLAVDQVISAFVHVLIEFTIFDRHMIKSLNSISIYLMFSWLLSLLDLGYLIVMELFSTSINTNSLSLAVTMSLLSHQEFFLFVAWSRFFLLFLALKFSDLTFLFMSIFLQLLAIIFHLPLSYDSLVDIIFTVQDFPSFNFAINAIFAGPRRSEYISL